MEILLSVIVPVYKVEKYLDECLESILEGKDREDAEVVLVDDGSPDKSGEICDRWAEKYSCVRVIHQENGGLSRARNVGIEAGRGRYMMFVDSDDMLAEGALARITALLRSQSPQVLLYNLKLPSDSGWSNEYREEMFSGGMEGFLSEATIRFPVGVVAYAFVLEKRFLVENCLWFYPGIYHEDMLWTPRVLCAVKSLTVCEDVLYIPRAQDGRESIIQTKANWGKRIGDLAVVSEELNKEARRYGTDRIRSSFLLRVSAIAQQSRLLLAAEAGELEETVREIRGNKEAHPELACFPKKFGLCVRLLGLRRGTGLFKRIWK